MSQSNQQITIRANALNKKLMPQLGGNPAYDELWITCGEEGEPPTYGGGAIWSRVELPFSQYFGKRDITLDSSSPENFEEARGWIKACHNHKQCGTLAPVPLPKRVVNVGTQDSKAAYLELGDGKVGQYLTLSYCWGSSPGITTTFDTLDEHLRQLPVERLPTTLSDAIHITRELGFQYLWIDAFCILQSRFSGDQEAIADWQDQCSKMADIYGNAFLTIAASGGKDKSEGCFLPRSPDSLICQIPLTDDPSIGFVYARPPVRPTQYIKQPLDDRAWTFQEASLSRRLLQYGTDEISYLCQTSSFFESGDYSSHYSPTRISFRGPQLFAIQTKETDKRQRALMNWYRSIESEFCGRLLTNDSDMLPALSGVAHRFQPLIDGMYHAGLWETDLLRGLLWKCRNVIPNGKGIYLTEPSSYRAPSWSWASLNGSIYYGNSEARNRGWKKEEEKSPTKILEIKTTLVGPAFDPMGQVSDGFIKINAPVKKAVVVSKTDNDYKTSFTDSKGVVNKFMPKINHQLLVGEEVTIKSDPESVGAFGHFDIEKLPAVTLTCLLLTAKEGLMLVPVSGQPEKYKRYKKKLACRRPALYSKPPHEVLRDVVI
ncbi:hypothetical protein B7463_g1301, partial [Scytalidium lignicola]